MWSAAPRTPAFQGASQLHKQANRHNQKARRLNFYLYGLRISEHTITWLGPGRKEEEGGYKVYLKILKQNSNGLKSTILRENNIHFIWWVFNSSTDLTIEEEVELMAGGLMTGLSILKLDKLQHLLSGPSPGPLPIPIAGRPQPWPDGQGFCVYLFVEWTCTLESSSSLCRAFSTCYYIFRNENYFGSFRSNL